MWSCAPAPVEPGTVQGRSWTHAPSGRTLTFPPGWQVAADPALFQAGLPSTVLEGRHVDGTSLAVSWLPLPDAVSRQTGATGALDLLGWVAPAPLELQNSPSWRMERLADCGGVIARRWDADGVHLQHALADARGVLLLHAWRADGAVPTVLEPLTCGR